MYKHISGFKDCAVAYLDASVVLHTTTIFISILPTSVIYILKPIKSHLIQFSDLRKNSFGEVKYTPVCSLFPVPVWLNCFKA